MPRDILDSVYRLIASNRYVEAMHVINKLLKKQPNYLIAKVWKCEALYGLGQVTESEDLMTSIIEQAPSDKRTVDSIAEFYRARGNYPKLVEIYENALKSDPNDENWRKALFECCGLAGDYKKQQQQALIIYKQSPRMLYYCMAVVCLLQQADENPVALELAERMMMRQHKSGQLIARNEILLLLNVLEKRDKNEEALELLDESSGELAPLISVVDKRIELLHKLKRWADSVKILKDLLKEKPDNWLKLKQYLEAVMELQAVGGEVPDDALVDDSIQRAREFLNFLCKENPKLRGPFLAEIELIKLTFSSDENSAKNLCELIAKYFKNFGAKAISVFDLSQYVSLVPASMTQDLLNNLSTPKFNELSPLKFQEHMGAAQHVSFLQISKLLGAQTLLKVEEREQFCLNLEEWYRAAEGCDRREQYLILLAHERCALFRETKNANHLVLAACLLEESLLQAQVFAIQVILLQIYFALGASKAARKIYEQLRIQSVQVDTLVHIFLANITSTGNFSTANEMWETALKILQQCSAESLEALVWCYRAGLYHRVEEFTNCTKRLLRTITVPLLRGEKAFLDLVLGEPSRTEVTIARPRPAVSWEDCVDNRDLRALPTWDPPASHMPSSQSYTELLLFCKIREATISSLAAAITFAKQREEAPEKVFRTCLDELQRLCAEAITVTSHERELFGTGATRLHQIAQVPLPSLLEKILEPDLGSSEKIISILTQMADSCAETVTANQVKNPRVGLEAAVTQIEALTVVTMACGSVRPWLLPPQRRRLDQIARILITNWNKIEQQLPIAHVPQIPSSSTRDVVEAKLKESYQASSDDFRKVIRKKILRKISTASKQLHELTGLPIIHSDGYVCSLPANHKFPMPKFKMIMDLLVADGVVDRRRQLAIPEPITFEEAATVHSPEYVDKFFTGKTTRDEQRRTGFVWSPGLVSRVRLETGGTLLASKIALARGMACSTGGGTHHAFPTYGSGYCLINDLAVAARLSKRRVLIVDLDVHQGDGTAAIFHDDSLVFTLSLHAEKNFPFRKERSDLDVPLPNGLGDSEYLKILQDYLEPIINSFRPDLALYDAGVDPHLEDELGKLALTDQGLFKRDAYVLGSMVRSGVPVAAVIGGGYCSNLSVLARRHTILHRAATKVWRDRGL